MSGYIDRIARDIVDKLAEDGAVAPEVRIIYRRDLRLGVDVWTAVAHPRHDISEGTGETVQAAVRELGRNAGA